MKTLEALIYNLPLFDDTESEQPCLESICYELGLTNTQETFEVEQEDLANKLCEYLRKKLV